MRPTTLLLTLAVLVQTALQSAAYTVSTPPGNIVQNGNFQSDFANWSGNIPAILGNWPSVPNNYAALAKDIYQVLPTTPGQQYSLSFYAAADLFFAPSVRVTVALDGATLASFDTPAYAYNPQLNRYEQMHWEELTYTFTASSSATRLEFIDLNTPDFGLAAVRVISVPEPGSLTFLFVGGLMMALVRRGRS